MTNSVNRRFAVTGAGGFLGGAVVRRLREDDYFVRGLYRNKPSGVAERNAPQEQVSGDIMDRNAIDRLLVDTDCVIHTVSNFRALDDPPEEYWRVNVEGTRQLLEAAVASGVKRFVHCSTIGVHGDVDAGPANEGAAYNPGDLYQETKLAAEKLCHAYMGRPEMEVVVIRPCSMFGPGDDRLLKLFRLASKRWFVMIGNGRSRFHSIYIDDIADAFRTAAVSAQAANNIFIAGQPESVELREYIQSVAASVGNKLHVLRVPYWPVFVIALMSEKVLGLIGQTSPLTVRRLRFFRNNRDFDTRKISELIGFRTRVGLDEGLARTADAYRQAGWI